MPLPKDQTTIRFGLSVRQRQVWMMNGRRRALLTKDEAMRIAAWIVLTVGNREGFEVALQTLTGREGGGP